MATDNNSPTSRFFVIDELTLENLITKCVRTELTNVKVSTVEKEDRILFIDDAMRFLGVSRQTIYGYTSRKEIPFYKKGKKLYFRQSDLEKWLNKGRHKSMDEFRDDALDYLNQNNNGKGK